MAKNRSGEEYSRLKKIGLELRGATDEFSEQPASGGVIGGLRGSQEFGIEGGLAQEEGHDRNRTSNVDINSADIETEGERFPQEVMDRDFPGISEYSGTQLSQNEENARAFELALQSNFELQRADDDPSSTKGLEMLLRDRIRAHPRLRKENIEATISGRGHATLTGGVHSQAAKMDAKEVTEAIIGHSDIENNLDVFTK